MHTFQRNDRVELFARHTGESLGTGTVVGSPAENRITVEHADGAATMVEGINDPYFRLEALDSSREA